MVLRSKSKTSGSYSAEGTYLARKDVYARERRLPKRGPGVRQKTTPHAIGFNLDGG